MHRSYARKVALIALAVAAIAALVVLVVPRGNPPALQQLRQPGPRNEPARKGEHKEGTTTNPIAALAASLASGDRQMTPAAARALRSALIADPSLLDRVLRALLDPSTPLALREALAVIVGTLPGEAGKRALLEALRSGALAGLERAAILALGATEIDDGEAFERDGQPYAVQAAPGLTTLIYGSLADPEMRAEIARRLGSADATDRWAAARALRDSRGFPEVRGALLDRLAVEPDAETAAEMGAALGEWTQETPPGGAERELVLSKLLEAAPMDEIVRFRLTAPLSETPLGPAVSLQLRLLAGNADAEVRRFAVDLLGHRMEDPEALSLVANAATFDANADVREAAVLALGRAVTMDRVVDALMTALGQDTDWEVRAAAARSLGRARASDAARSVLERAASNDPRAEVRAAAMEALSGWK